MAFVMLYTQTSFILSQMPCFVSSWSLKITQNDCRILYGLKVLEFSKPFCEYWTLRSFLLFFFGHSEFCSKYPVELFLEGKILGMTSQGQRPWASSWLLLYFCRLCLRDVDFSEGGRNSQSDPSETPTSSCLALWAPHQPEDETWTPDSVLLNNQGFVI